MKCGESIRIINIEININNYLLILYLLYLLYLLLNIIFYIFLYIM